MNAPALKLQATPLRQVDSVKGLLMNAQARDQLAAVAASHMSPERMMRVVANAIRTTPKLGQCEPMSFLGALMQCASLGLEPNTVLGHAYMIPFDKNKKVKNERTGREEWIKVSEVQVIIGYKGLIDLARRSGHITSISANVHYSDDELWEYEEGTEARLRHRPGMLKGDKLHAYAIAKFKDGGHAYVVLPWAHIKAIRDGSQGWQQAVRMNKTAESPWGKHEDEMAKKTAVRALAKYLPLSVEFMDAMAADEAQADYRSFAMDPTQGLQTDPEDYIDGETGEAVETQTAQIEDGRAGQQTLEPEREKTPAKPRQRRDDTPYNQMATSEAKPAADEAPKTQAGPDPEQFRSIVDRIAGDLLDGADPQEVLAGFRPEIAAMKAQAPEIFADLRKEVEGFDPSIAQTL